MTLYPRVSAACVAAILFSNVCAVRAQTSVVVSGSASWNNSANWSPATVPNAVGASATFNGAATGSNPAQTANRTITADAALTVGSMTFRNDASTFTTTITTGTGGSLAFDQSGAGPATIIVPAVTGTGNNTISVPITLSDSLTAVVSNTTASSAAGALNLTATMSGPGGFTKLGDGLATFGTGAKAYAGPTILSGGRMRISNAAHPSATASFTINAGAQLTLITAATFAFGTNALNLNGAGATTGPFAAFPGVIRPDSNLGITISNSVVLQSDTVIHVQGANGFIVFPSAISGPGRLTLTGTPHDANLGSNVLSAANTYSGGTVIDGGTLVVSNASGSLGTGNVRVNSANASFSSSSAKLVIQTGTTNAIADTATLLLAGGAVAGVADDGYVELQTGVNEIIGGLVLGGVAQAPGTYGSTASAATFQNNEYFAGTGIVTVEVKPVLNIARSGPQVTVSWPTNADGFVLQHVPAFSAASNMWTDVTNTVVVSGGNNTVSLEATNGNDFFRLKK
jgi:fibronectin-binding autotransporter adhesin